MACLKLSIGCLATVGLIVVVVVVLLAGGCVGLFAWGAKHNFGVPERASRLRIESDHRALLTEVKRQLDSGGDFSRWPRPAGLVALREHHAANESADRDLLGATTTGWHSHIMVNGSGVGTVDGRDCLIYAVQSGAREVWVYIADPGATPPAKPGPE